MNTTIPQRLRHARRRTNGASATRGASGVSPLEALEQLARAGRATRPSSSSSSRRADSSAAAQPVRADQRVERHRVVAERLEQRICRRAAGAALRRVGGRGGARRQPAARRGCRARCSTSLAPCLISAWQPRACGEWIEPGIANTSRPASAASRAVISEPDCERRPRPPACRAPARR